MTNCANKSNIEIDKNSARHIHSVEGSIMDEMVSLFNAHSSKLDVSVIIPTYNEEKHIAQCLNSICYQDYPTEKLEIIVVDGMSTDATCAIVKSYMESHSNIRLTQNEFKSTSTAMNIGIHLSCSDVIIRLDGHAEAPPNYVSKSVDNLINKKTDFVGCLMETIGWGYWGKRIAIALSSQFGVGNAHYRTSNKELCDEPGWLGTFWRNSLLTLGGYDETYKCNEDCELTYRMLDKGYSLYTPSDLSCKYHCRNNLKSLWQQYFKYGFWKVALILKLRKIPAIRHVIPALFVVTLGVLSAAAFFSSFAFDCLLLVIAAYFGFMVLGSWKASRGKNIDSFYTIIPVFITLHLSYGLGFLCGIFSLFVSALKSVKKRIDLTYLKQLYRPLLQNKISAFAIYVADAAYDFAKYLIYSGNLYAIRSSDQKLQSLIQMYSHKIEKRLVLNENSQILDAIHVTRLIRLLEKYSTKNDCSKATFLSAYAALAKYKERFESELQRQSRSISKYLNSFLIQYSYLNGNGFKGGIKIYDSVSALTKNKEIDYDFFVQSRHSIRNFTQRSISREILNKAIEQARWTPSVCNRQPWRVHVFESANDKKKALSIQNGNDGFGDSADKILLITCDIRSFFTSRERNQCFIDGGMFSMSLIYALHASGVASCPLNLSTYSFQDFKLHKLLGIPMHETPIMMMAIGYPPNVLNVTCSQRLPVEWFIRYRDD